MKKILLCTFLGLALFLTFTINVNAAINKPTSSSIYAFGYGVSSVTTLSYNSAWAGRNGYFIAQDFYMGSTSPFYEEFYFHFNQKLCTDKNCVITGYIQTYSSTSTHMFSEKPRIWLSNNTAGTTVNCSVNSVSWEYNLYSTAEFSCSTNNISNFTIGMALNTYVSGGRYNVGIATNDFTITENINQGDVIINDNKNTDKIIENNDKNQRQTNAKIDEVNETSKGILGKIGDLLLNIIELPGKLITGLIDGIKSLFIPEGDFFSNWFNELWSFLQEKLGILLLPFTLIGDILTRFLSLSSGAYIISIPAVTMPIWGGTIIPATTFDFATLTSNSVIGNMHSIYLMVVDVIIIFALVNLAKKKYEEMMSGGTSE